MKRSLVGFFLVLFYSLSYSQSVPFPPNPGNTNQLENWGYTQVGTNWDTSPFLPFIYNKMWFRLMPPNGVTYNSTTKVWTNAVPGKKYPLILFFHGNGESTNENNNQLKNGGQVHRDAVLSGKFPGFLFYPQVVTDDQAKQILERILIELPVDVNQIYVHGLSGGGGKTWTFSVKYPTLVAAAFPMSAADNDAENANLLYQPFRQAQGALDASPTPAQSQGTVDWYINNGGHLEYFVLPGVGHGTWNTMYARPDFFPWFLAQKKNKIFVRYDKNLLCPEAPISVDMGFTPGFDAYEWRLNGNLLVGQTSHKLIATAYGSYTGRIQNRGTWSEWSDPVVVGVKPTTNTPPIVTNGIKSIVLPALDGGTTTELFLPAGYQSYSWKNALNQVVSTSQVFTNVPVGTYTATANEVNGCTTIPSAPFNVINASGIKSPDPISSFLGYAISQTQISLSWTDKPSPNFNETGFEVYRSTNADGPFTLASIVPADGLGYVDSNLTPNTTYFYKVRPVNQFSAGPVSELLTIFTQVDNIAPTAPSNLAISGTTPSSVSLFWTPSTDNAGIFKYDLFVDDVKVLATSSTSATIYNLTNGQTYKFTVKARDLTGNYSPESNLVVASPVLSGLQYKYYEAASTFGPNLPNFNSLTPLVTDYSATADISVRKRDPNIAFFWQGTINIPVAGNYTFVTNSDDGSKLYIGSYNEANKVVDNDGSHGVQDREGTKNFTQPGVYPIIITYYNGTGSFGMTLSWKNTAHGQTTKVVIPASAFIPAQVLAGSPPQAPLNLTATASSFDKINLTWVDNSNNETGFRIYRSTTNTGSYIPVATVGANSTSYQDQQLSPSQTYYYRIKAIGQFGESALSTQIPRGLAYSYYEAIITNLTQLSNLVPKKTGTSAFFDVNLRERNENFALKWIGKINITTAATYTFYASSDDGSTIHIDGAQVVSNDTDGSLKEKSGTKALTVGWHDIEVRWRRKNNSSNNRLTVSYSRTGMSKTAITSANSTPLFFGTEINATTLALPAAPLVPTNAALANLSPTSFSLTWQDNAFDETSYQILRSYKTNANFVIYKTLPAGSSSFVDDGLYANASYFYKIQVIGPGGSTTTTQLTGATSNNAPDLTSLPDVAIKYGKVLDVHIYAEDNDNDPIILNVTGLPSFATFVDYGDGTGNIHFTPASNQLGDYNLVVTAYDNHSGINADGFVLTVTDKDTPVILPITSPTVSEGQSGNMLISATSDFGPENLTWSFDGLPGFATPSIDAGLCQITLAPGYIHSGVYPIEVTVTDPLSVSTKKSFTITVQDLDPNSKVLVNIVNSSNGASPWNNMNGLSISGLRDGSGNTTTIGAAFQTTAWNTFTEGAVTGNNSGVFPDNVIRDYYYFGIFGAPATIDVKVTGLDITRNYNFGFFGSSKWNGVPDNGSTVYAIKNTAVSLRVQNNKMGIATINSVTPDPDGSVTFKMSKASGAPVGYLNAFTVEAVYQDGTVPAAPRNVQAVLSNYSANVSWVDAPFNEDGFDIYRSESETGPFTKLNEDPLAKNTVSYTDNTVQDGTTYYYQLKAFNTYGESTASNTATLVLPNLPPRIDVTGSLSINPDEFSMLSIASSADAILTVNGLPDFAFLSPVSESAADIILLPAAVNTGTYLISLVAVDAFGLTTTQNLSLVVPEKVLYRVYVNFNQNFTASAPWNNTAKVPAVNDTFSNLKNDSNVGSGVNLTLQTAFGGVFNEGAQTGNNSGVVPDNVLKEYYWFGAFSAPNTVTMKVSGLSLTNKYRFKFVASSIWSQYPNNGSTVFTIGSKSVSVNVQNNTTQLGVIQDVITNAQGEVYIQSSKGVNATAGFINGLIIEALPVDPAQFVPTNLTAAGFSKTQIVLKWSDNSPVETGYEIHRSTSGAEGSYSLIATTAADITTYTDAVAQQNQMYYYRVRATTVEGPSAFTNDAKSSAISFKVFVNISGAATYDAPAPWNNTSRFGFTGDIFYGFKNEDGAGTGFRLIVKTQLEGNNNWGTTTGSNSGIFPDKVLNDFWFNDAYFPQGEFIIDGLDQTYSYNFGFLGSIDVTNVVNTNFTINGVTVTNRNDKNTSNVSYIRNVKPDSNSEILFSVKEAPGSPWSIFNALVIEAYATGGQQNAGGRIGQNARRDGNLKEVRFGEGANAMKFYPNPVESNMHVVLEDASIGEVRYEVYDMMGREMQKGQFTNDVINSESEIQIDLPSAVYLLKLTYPDGRFEARKFIKN